MISKTQRFKNDYKYVIFDFDGTINDTSPGIFAAFKKTLDVFGVDYSKVDFRRHIGPPLEYSFRELVGDDKWMEAIPVYRKIFIEDDGLRNSKLYDGVKETLAAVKKCGYVVALATSKYEPFALESLKMLDIEQYFDYVYAQNDRRQYKDEILSQLIGDNGWDKSLCVMVGDTHFDVQGAHANGIDVIAVTYGFEDKDALVALSPEAVVDSPREIYQALTGKKL